MGTKKHANANPTAKVAKENSSLFKAALASDFVSINEVSGSPGALIFDAAAFPLQLDHGVNWRKQPLQLIAPHPELIHLAVLNAQPCGQLRAQHSCHQPER